jgi:hypothetical protein
LTPVLGLAEVDVTGVAVVEAPRMWARPAEQMELRVDDVVGSAVSCVLWVGERMLLWALVAATRAAPRKAGRARRSRTILTLGSYATSWW